MNLHDLQVKLNRLFTAQEDPVLAPQINQDIEEVENFLSTICLAPFEFFITKYPSNIPRTPKRYLPHNMKEMDIDDELFLTWKVTDKGVNLILKVYIVISGIAGKSDSRSLHSSIPLMEAEIHEILVHEKLVDFLFDIRTAVTNKKESMRLTM